MSRQTHQSAKSHRGAVITVVIGCALVLAMTTLSACGGGGEAGNPTVTGTEGQSSASASPLPTEGPTQKPTEKATSVAIPKLLEQPVVPTDITTAKNAVDALYINHLETNNFTYQKSPYSKQDIDRVIDLCEKGYADDAGSPKLIALDRVVGCRLAIKVLLDFQGQSSSIDYFNAAVAVHNYALTTFEAKSIEKLEKDLKDLGIQ